MANFAPDPKFPGAIELGMGWVDTPFNVENIRMESGEAPSQVRVGWFRSVNNVMHAWSELCKTGPRPPSPEFTAVYPFMTTVQGNRFRFRGGDPAAMKDNLQRLFRSRFGGGAPIKTTVEN